jgi:hypothetical protein
LLLFRQNKKNDNLIPADTQKNKQRKKKNVCVEIDPRNEDEIERKDERILSGFLFLLSRLLTPTLSLYFRP